MLTPNRRVAVIARAPIASALSETRTVGGLAETEVKAVTVMPHGLSPSQQVTITTPLASMLMASAKSAAGAGWVAGSVISLRGGHGFSLAASGR